MLALHHRFDDNFAVMGFLGHLLSFGSLPDPILFFESDLDYRLVSPHPLFFE